ncbi:hypothetical protein DAKH74_047370 [Maudiozyma humilis]|uniref:HMG box domain-containing protein n=1 Tax=Maudiozyma humilis TaxID=51915 RepID=A0AAV5S4Y7_MAUHU|nr:hypothetical protein DAKH74_047370 [Kazachstania humilis]
MLSALRTSVVSRYAGFCTSAVTLAARGVPTASQLRSLKIDELKARKPKKPLNGYMLFSNDHRDAIAAKNPGKSPNDIFRLIGKEWCELSEQDKQPYLDEAARKLEAHKAEVKQFEQSLPPKKPAGPFIQFSQDIRQRLNEEYPAMSFGEKSKITSARWAALSEEERQEYKDRYSKQIILWKAAVDAY